MSELLDTLRDLRDRLAGVELTLDLGGAGDARRDRRELLDQIDDYLVPRLERIDAPLLAVVGGSTGAGKSTITNSLAGADVSTAGVLRPTTRVPVLVCHPDDEGWFRDGGVLPDLARSSGAVPAAGAGLHVVDAPGIPAGLGLLDAPDIDSVELANHDLAAQLLGAADLWVFVTTAARYADAVPWEYLARARERSVALGVVVNRVPPGASAEIRTHLAEMLEERGLGDARLFALDETELVDGRFATDALADVHEWLHGLVADADARAELVRRTVAGSVASIPARVDRVTAALRTQAATAERLGDLAAHHYEDALAGIDAELDKGTLLRGEVLDRWREQVGTGEFMDRLLRGVGRARDRVRSVLRGTPVPDEAAQGQLESNLEILIRHAADAAALATVEGWEQLPGGAQLLDASPRGLDRASADLAERSRAEIERWEQGVIDLVQAKAGNKVAVARTLSLGINGVGVALMIAVFSQTGGITGAEAGVAAGTAAASQTVLTAVFGEQAVRDLARQARQDLQLRLVGLFEAEQRRFDDLLAGLDDTAVDGVAAAAAAVTAANR